MEKVVYVLGAGFSAPLGLPVMSNFLGVAKQMHREHPDDFSHFKPVLDEIKRIDTVLKYFHADLFNIEELLSIYETNNRLRSKEAEFIQLIKDVITSCTPTPDFDENEITPSDLGHRLFTTGGTNRWQNYGHFLSHLCNLYVSPHTRTDTAFCVPDFNFIAENEIKYSYSIISLNYDLVVETILDYLNKRFREGSDIILVTSIGVEDHSSKCLNFCKLHGSVNGDIIAPTANKGYMSDEILGHWKLALKVLTDANHIRMLGYSLPVSDSYIKYLFKAAILDCYDLKSFDVICLDPNGDVQRRYNEFIQPGRFKFYAADVSNYLESMAKGRSYQGGDILFNKIEERHNIYPRVG